MEYIIFCDESTQNGPLYSDFFGGAIVSANHIDQINKALNAKKEELNLNGEVKWTKVTENYVEKYGQLMDLFFSFVADGKIKVRIMFRKNTNVPSRRYSTDDKYFKLYYQFIKNAFGLCHCPFDGNKYFRIYLDQLPDTKEKCKRFKEFIYKMQHSENFVLSKVWIRQSDIAEVISHDHVILQCVDVILGAMFFRLNDLHKAKPQGAHRRGKRTVAKEKLYKRINGLICDIFPRFNIGVSTGSHGFDYPHWESPYEHWSFVPQ